MNKALSTTINNRCEAFVYVLFSQKSHLIGRHIQLRIENNSGRTVIYGLNSLVSILNKYHIFISITYESKVLTRSYHHHMNSLIN